MLRLDRMHVRKGLLIVALCFSSNVFADVTDRPQVDRKKVGLVLSGGGAKGAAHIGVLEVLEENRIPVDIITGTSMGAYVGGMYAMGLTAKEVKERTLNANWDQGYNDRAKRNDLTLRRKQQNDDFQLHTDLGLDLNGEFKARPSAFQGQGMAVLLRSLTHNLPAVSSFDKLPIPYRSVATDIAKVAPYVISSGHLATAMQASMTVPGALKPVKLDGKLLVDGGVVNNMPVDIAQKLGADVIIAVDLRDSLLPQKDLESALNIISQLTTYMTNASADHQKSLLHSGDVYMQPDVSFMLAPDFDKMELAYRAGRNIANKMLPALLKFQVSPAQYEQYLEEKKKRRSQLAAHNAYYIDTIDIDNHTRLSDTALLALLDLKTKRIISNEELEEAVNRLQSQDIFAKVGYEIEHRAGKNVLVMKVDEKSWGPGYLNFKLSFEDDFSERSDFTFGAQYIYTDVTDKGGEWTLEAQLGSWKKVNTELYLPFDYDQKFFGSFGASWNNEIRQFSNIKTDSFSFNLQTEYMSYSSFAELGWNIQPWAVLKMGYRVQDGKVKVLLNNYIEDFSTHGPYWGFTYDNLDNFYFPSKGFYVSSLFGLSNTVTHFLGARSDDYGSYYNFSLIKPWNIKRHSLVGILKSGGSDSSELIPVNVQDLGGLFNLSGYHRYELNGRYSAFAGLVYRYRLFDNDFGAFSSPVYVGGSIEHGGVWDNSSDMNWNSAISAGSLFFAIDSFLGPVYLGYGQSSTGENSVYFSVGGGIQN
ncbi:patatin-like phospholipase family protein [Photobacterium damselae]|uniref:patatin-like phospholipase family protein n=1 Tax=Photobacterium damselae TaxID=38293 RepID=UPI002543F358